MSSGEYRVNISRLLMTFNIDIIALPDDLKCIECRSVLRDACQMPCDCRLCRTCIDDVMAGGGQFCPGGSRQCCVTPLSTAVPDYRANNSIWKLTAKCPHVGCSHECRLVDMEDHLRLCHRQTIDYPFSPLCSIHSTLNDGRISDPLQDWGNNNEIKDEIKSIKCQMKSIKIENESIKDEIKLIKNENKSIKEENKLIENSNKFVKDEMKSIKIENESIKDENKSIKEENKDIKDSYKSMKDEMKSIKIENESIKDEIKSIKNDNESIKREKEVLSEQVRQLLDKLEREINERRQSDEREGAIISSVVSDRDALSTEIEPVIDDIRSIKDQFDSMKCQVESIQVALGLGQLDDWLIDEDFGKVEWGWFSNKTSGRFSGEGRPQIYELVSFNSASEGKLKIWLRIWAGPSDSLLEWPFRGAVTITVAHRNKRQACSRQTRQCQIEKPADNDYSYTSDTFKFPHASLKKAGLELERGVRVSCQIVPGTGQ